ncbi:MAG: peptide chain release factor 3, partial [Bdellovibrionales bacterium]|nr:peptide chain release factor 3 [Bdellovibrionales bacterium]
MTTEPSSLDSLQRQIAQETAKRRTFAIISHPDAGKTTLTEKLLLYAGMIRTAGMVRGRKSAKNVSSDWMAMEQERGISITASAMQFGYKGVIINVLDTPGHQDFSEDTYRTLTAADSAVMVLDAAHGVQEQTRKLFAVCRMRNTPILTFINKMDLPGKDPFDLLSEVEEVLGIKAAPLYWPIGTGKEFRGVADCADHSVMLFEKTSVGGSQRAAKTIMSLDEAASGGRIPPDLEETLRYELELLQEAGNAFSREEFLAGTVTPVFFGSALTNFGVEPFFDRFAEFAPAPGPREATTDDGTDILIDPVGDPFSAYVFKLQANMDPRHRDSMAYLRV